MQKENQVLCASSAYEGKYYFNKAYATLPETIQNELKIMCVLFTSEIGGIFTLEFTQEGSLFIHVTSEEADILFDEIGSILKVKELQLDKKELLESLEKYYSTFFLL